MAIAGLVVNGAAALVVVAVARLVTSQSYGAIAQLLGLFFILSMPGSAVLVGVVRRVTALHNADQADRVRRWVGTVHRIVLAAIAVEMVVVLLIRDWIARQLSLPNSQGVVLILVAAGVWILLCVDRGLLQAHRRYRALAGNLLMEGGVRTVLVLVLVAAHVGVAGYAVGVFVGEVAATAPCPLAGRTGARLRPGPPAAGHRRPDTGGGENSLLARRRLMADVAAAFCGLALLGLLQNVDVILLGRLDHANVGPYAAISVASKALVFGALALGAYLLPEATIRWNEGGHAVRQLGVTLIFLAVPAAPPVGHRRVRPQGVPHPGVRGQAEHGGPGLRPPGGGHDVPLLLRPGHQLPVRHRLPLDRRCCWRPDRAWPWPWWPHADGQTVATARADLAGPGRPGRRHGGGLRDRAISGTGPVQGRWAAPATSVADHPASGDRAPVRPITGSGPRRRYTDPDIGGRPQTQPDGSGGIGV